MLCNREDERLVRMLSEHLSLYLALGSHYRRSVSVAACLYTPLYPTWQETPMEELETVEKIGWICPETSGSVPVSFPQPSRK